MQIYGSSRGFALQNDLFGLENLEDHSMTCKSSFSRVGLVINGLVYPL